MMTSEQSDSEQHPDRSHQDGREKLRNECVLSALQFGFLRAKAPSFPIILCPGGGPAARGPPPAFVNPPLPPRGPAGKSPPAESISMAGATCLGNYDLLAEIARGGMG